MRFSEAFWKERKLKYKNVVKNTYILNKYQRNYCLKENNKWLINQCDKYLLYYSDIMDEDIL